MRGKVYPAPLAPRVLDPCLQHHAPVRGSKGRRALSRASAKRGQIATLERDRLTKTDIMGAFEFTSGVRSKAHARTYCHWKTNYEQQHYQTHRPIWNFENGKIHALATCISNQATTAQAIDNFVNVALF